MARVGSRLWTLLSAVAFWFLVLAVHNFHRLHKHTSDSPPGAVALDPALEAGCRQTSAPLPAASNQDTRVRRQG